jgi:hypothetical protein
MSIPRYCLSIEEEGQADPVQSYYFDDLDAALVVWEVLERYARPEVTATLEERDSPRLAVLRHGNAFREEPSTRPRVELTRQTPPKLAPPTDS